MRFALRMDPTTVKTYYCVYQISGIRFKLVLPERKCAHLPSAATEVSNRTIIIILRSHIDL